MVATPKIHYQLDDELTVTGSLEDKNHYVEPTKELAGVERATSHPEMDELPLPINIQNRDHSEPSPQSTVCVKNMMQRSLATDCLHS